MKNKAVIDLDWLDSEIEKLKRDYTKSLKDDRLITPSTFFEAVILGFEDIRSKCEPVKESFTEDDMISFAEWLNDKAAKPEYLQYTITGFLAIWKAELEEKQNKWSNEHQENSTSNQ